MTATLNVTDAALPPQADVVVVGAGLAGLFSAFYAARAGLGKVVLLERRSAVADLTSAHSAEGFRLEWGCRENIEMVRDSIEVFDNFAEVIGIRGYDIGVQKSGYLFLSGSVGPSYRAAKIKARVERWRDLGLTDVEYMSGEEARSRFPFVSENVEEAHFRAGDGVVVASAIARGLVLGGDFGVYLDTAVEAIEAGAGRVAGVRTASGKVIAAPIVIVAGGPFTRRLVATAGPEVPIDSRRRHGLIVFLPPGQVDRTWPMVVDADLGLYWRPRPEGIFIGWERALPWDDEPTEGLDPVPADPRYLGQVEVHGRRLTSFWRDLRFENVQWHAGQYVSSRPYDGRPIIGGHPEVAGLYLNTAYEGRGVMASPAGSQLLVRLIEGLESESGNPFRVSMDGRGHTPDDMVL
jgi:sarcosine oxidase, subunit beta